MNRSIIWGGAVWVIAMMLVSDASAGAKAIAQNQPAPNVPIASVSPPDQKGNFEAVASVAIAAIDAARHSTEESKTFYAGYSQLLVWAAAVISGLGALGLYGGFLFLRSRAETIAEQTATSAAKTMLDKKMVDIDSVLKIKTDEMENIKTNLNNHIVTYDAFNNSMRAFRDQITVDLEAFLTVIPKSLELAFWIGQHREKAPADPTRPTPQAIARLVIEVCAEARSKKPAANQILAYIYGYEGAAYRLLDKLCRSL